MVIILYCMKDKSFDMSHLDMILLTSWVISYFDGGGGVFCTQIYFEKDDSLEFF